VEAKAVADEVCVHCRCAGFVYGRWRAARVSTANEPAPAERTADHAPAERTAADYVSVAADHAAGRGGLTAPVPFAPPARDLFRARQPFNTNPFKSFPYGGGAYFDGYPESVTPGHMMPPPAIGLLRFDVTPQSAQVFVDSFYAGTIADIEAQRVLTLAAGPHRIELQAAGYQPKTFDVRIDPNDTIVYRAALERERTAATAAARPTGPTRMWVIPGCYAGNMAPRADRLPSGCDIKQVRVIDPPK